MIIDVPSAKDISTARIGARSEISATSASVPFRIDARERIETLVSNVPISLVARDENGTVIGAVFGITDFAYWLFVTDLGVARDWEKKGIGTALLQQAHAAAGGEKDIAMYLVANENAIPFYEKFGMWKTTEVMEYNHIDWTPFTVE